MVKSVSTNVALSVTLVEMQVIWISYRLAFEIRVTSLAALIQKVFLDKNKLCILRTISAWFLKIPPKNVVLATRLAIIAKNTLIGTKPHLK